MPHEVISHSSGEYVVHTQNIESFWSPLKRGVVGTYDNVSKKYLPNLNGFAFRLNNRRTEGIFWAAIRGC
jgi:ISXO2-like transposase domain